MTRSGNPVDATVPAGDALPAGAIPGELLVDAGERVLNEGQPVTTLRVANSGDRPVQIGSHYHFAEANPGLLFDRAGSGSIFPPAPPSASNRARRARSRSFRCAANGRSPAFAAM